MPGASRDPGSRRRSGRALQGSREPGQREEGGRHWAARLAANPKDFESAYKLAQARYWLGTNGLPEPERKAALEAGIAAARSAIALDAERPEGHFWLAANMGALAESFGMRQGIKYRGPIKDALLDDLKLDPAFLDGSADRALGRWYYKVPGLFGGSNKQSEMHLRKSLPTTRTASSRTSSSPRRSPTWAARTKRARKRRRRIDAPFDPDWTPEDRRFKETAKRAARTRYHGHEHGENFRYQCR